MWELVPKPKGVNVIGPSGFLRTSQKNMVLLLETNQGLLLKDTHKWKGLILMRTLHW